MGSLTDLGTNGYYNKTIHTCKLKLHIPLDLINKKIYPKLYEKNEVAGIFYVNDRDQITDVNINEGDEGSVYTPNNVINYHTHPINAYRNAKTAFGSPSGEDYRETLKFALAGNKAHIVFTVEGLYIIQVSPCKIKKIKELLDDEERGILIFLIEEYFKTTHAFRCVDDLNKLQSKNITINPYSFADFANTFDIPNLLTVEEKVYKNHKDLTISETGHTGIHSKKNRFYLGGLEHTHVFSKIPNMGCPELDGKCIKTVPVAEYIDDYDGLRSINEFGEEHDPSSKIKIKKMLEKLKMIEKDFESTPCNIEWNSNPNAWFFVNFFPTEYYVNTRYRKGGKYIIPEENHPELRLKHEPFIRIFSNSKDGCKITHIAQKHNFNTNKVFNIGSTHHQNSTFGTIDLDSHVYSDIKYLTGLK
jgi:hypothetical protein